MLSFYFYTCQTIGKNKVFERSDIMDIKVAKDEIRDNYVEGNEALTKLHTMLNNQHGEVAFDKSLRAARLERDLIDSIVITRKRKKITQQQLAKSLETKAQQISKYERSEQIPSLSVLLKLCDALNLELSLTSKEDNEIVFHS